MQTVKDPDTNPNKFLLSRFEEAVELRITEPGINSEQRYADAKREISSALGIRPEPIMVAGGLRPGPKPSKVRGPYKKRKENA